jgi:hypothetical protein
MVTYSWLQIRKSSVKHEIKAKIISGIDDDQLVLLKFHKEELKSIRWEHSKEFEFKNEMYDVVKTESYGDSIFYLCWWDNEETKLNKQLSALVNIAFGKDPQRQEKHVKLYTLFKSLYVIEQFQWEAKGYFVCVNAIPKEPENLLHITFSPPVPPPQLI